MMETVLLPHPALHGAQCKRCRKAALRCRVQKVKEKHRLLRRENRVRSDSSHLLAPPCGMSRKQQTSFRKKHGAKAGFAFG
jgi:hypothetical protein